jgi:hypothetical protein
MSAATIARLKITLDDVKPAVLRRVEVPFDIRLDRLHLTIQAAMAWTNSHLYEIRIGDVGWSTPYPEQDWAGDFLDARKTRLGDALEDVGTKTLEYLYDFGDGWEHTIKIERLIERRARHRHQQPQAPGADRRRPGARCDAQHQGRHRSAVADEPRQGTDAVAVRAARRDRGEAFPEMRCT